jgi:hypothetical protein
MPIIIEEVVIKAIVTSQPAGSSPSNTQTRPEDALRGKLKELAKKINRQNER